MGSIADSERLHRIIVRVEKKDENGEEYQVGVAWQNGDHRVPQFTERVPFNHPFDEEVLESIRWYLEDYLTENISDQRERKARNVEKKMKECGKSLHNLLFLQNHRAVTVFHEAVRGGLDKCEMIVSSDDPAVLALPWELIYCDDYQFLGFSLRGLYRSHNNIPPRATQPHSREDGLYILLVICRSQDDPVPPGHVMSSILESQEIRRLMERGQVKFTLLRPPTFSAFEAHLSNMTGHYHIVHFDGHGCGGKLKFEDKDGGQEWIKAEKIAQCLINCQVPLFLLHACRSGAQTSQEAFSSVASQLVRSGAKAVVAVAYNFYADAARIFMTRLYEELIKGKTVSVAVAAGRKSLSIQASRGWRLLEGDWMVPVLYQQAEHIAYTPTLVQDEGCAALHGLPPAGRYGFIGRDTEIHNLDRKFQQCKLVFLTGDEGVGKSELARGFARWTMRTGGVKKLFYADFETTSAEDVLREIEGSLAGVSSLENAANNLKWSNSLLVWDNIDGLEDSNSNAKDLFRLVGSLSDGNTWILVVSRKAHKQLESYQHRRLQVGPMRAEEAAELGKVCMQERDLPENENVRALCENFCDNPGELLKELYTLG